MKRYALIISLVSMSLFVASGAFANNDSELFGENLQRLDASLNLRRATTEQFNPIRGQSVLARPRPDFDPVPLTFGGFQFYPAINIGPYYDSNIFASRVNTNDDVIWKINPTVALLSNWGRHAVGVTALGDIDYFQNNPKQSYKGGAVQIEGRYDIAQQTWASGDVSYQRVTELKGSPASPGNSVGGAQYNLYSAHGQAYRGVGRLKAKMDYNIGNYSYEPVTIIGGSAASQLARNRLQQRLDTEVSYDVSENLKPFVRLAYDRRTYETSGLRNSSGYQADVGARMDFGGIITAEAYLGYIAQDYYNFGIGETASPDFGGNILWNMTELTSLEARVSRSVQEVSIAGDSSYLNSEASVSVSHELMRDLILQGSVTYDALDYQGARRKDDYYNVGSGARYYINRYLYSDLTYNFQRRTSDAVANNYDRHTLYLRVGAQY